MYRVEIQCPTLFGDSGWHPVTDNPFWFFGNAQLRCNRLIWQVHAARVLDRAGNVLYQA